VRIVMAMVAVLVMAGVAAAGAGSWAEGDPHKMHYPQLPDPNGWDVNITRDTMWDDFQCSQSGLITDIHFWGSWRGDVTSPLLWIDVGIWADVAEDDPLNNLGYSHPDFNNCLWFQRFLPGQFTVMGPMIGDEGWFDPQPPVTVIPHDHVTYYQIDMVDIQNAFNQTEGEVYWLGIHAAPEIVGPEFGWKTSQNHWNDDAVYYYSMEGTIPGEAWWELIDPIDGQTSLDLAFVITPEPATLALVALGAVAILRRRR